MWNKQQKSHLLSQNVFLQSIIYPSDEKNSLEQAAFWHEVKVVCCQPTPLFTLSSSSRKTAEKRIRISPQFTDDKSNDISIREGIPLDALNWFGGGYELHTPESVTREGSKAWAFSIVPHFSLPTASRLSPVGWFSRVLRFRLLYYPWGKIGATHSLTTVYKK